MKETKGLSQYVVNNRLAVRAKPSSPKTEMLGFDEARKAVKIAIAAPPEDNKANIKLLKFVRKQLGRPVKLISGQTSHDKVLELA